LLAIVEFAEGLCGDGPVVIAGPKSCMRSIIRAFCIFVPFVDELYISIQGFLKGLPPVEPAGAPLLDL
jgi:hypothetical protein